MSDGVADPGEQDVAFPRVEGAPVHEEPAGFDDDEEAPVVVQDLYQ